MKYYSNIFGVRTDFPVMHISSTFPVYWAPDHENVHEAYLGRGVDVIYEIVQRTWCQPASQPFLLRLPSMTCNFLVKLEEVARESEFHRISVDDSLAPNIVNRD